MKQALQLKLGQSLTLTPQLQQSIRLLQLSTVELNQEIEEFLALNPFLERAETPDELGTPVAQNGPAALESPDHPETSIEFATTRDSIELSDYGLPTRSANGTGEDGDSDGFGHIAAGEATLAEHLLQQLHLMPLSERDLQIASVLVAHLDEDGYLTSELSELQELIATQVEVEPEDLSIALKWIQHLDPAGVGARNLGECLRLQLEGMPANTPWREQALICVNDYLPVLASRDFARLKRNLRVDDEGLRATRDLIVSLDPKPGRRFASGETRYVTPDVVVRKIGGEWRVFLNREAVPRLKINRVYADLIAKARDATGKQLSAQLQEARWMMKNVQQRFDTIVRVTEAIVDRQRNFFEHGEVAMRPLVLREIADQVGLHESTISRVTTQKYMLTSRGLYELKYFFGSHVATDTGGACSATAIRALIKQLVAAEDSKKPLSDNTISDLLAEQGIVVARRTVAKYREGLQIQPANLRKSI
jgi:RNA polymerase sigma-54 factor